MSIERDEITSLVRKVVTRTMGQYRRRPVINEESVRQMPTGSTQVIPADAIITPLASQIAIERKIEFAKDRTSSSASNPNNQSIQASEKRTITSGQKVVALGADHGGYELK